MKHEIDKVLSKEDMEIMLIALNHSMRAPDFLVLEKELSESRNARVATIDNIIKGLEKTDGVLVIDNETQEGNMMTKEAATKLFSDRREEIANELTDCERVRRLHQKISAILEFEQDNESNDDENSTETHH